MGTNFYWKKPFSKEPGEHLGKRSAAGLFCWDCGITLCKGGLKGVHHSEHSWHESCPKCGKVHEKGEAKAMFLELGFTKPRLIKPSGVHSCSSFTWALNPHLVREIIKRRPFKRVIDEYGRIITGRRFLKMIEINCPMEFSNMIGVEFC